MTADRRHGRTERAQAAVQLEEEEGVCELAGGVTLERTVALVSIQVVPVNPGVAMREAGGHHHPRALRLRKFRQQQCGQRKGAQVIDAELQLKALLRAHQRRVHDARIVDERIDTRFLRRQLGGGPDAREVGLVQG